jgi:hypothetical protein
VEHKDTKKREQDKINVFIFYAECIVTSAKPKIVKAYDARSGASLNDKGSLSHPMALRYYLLRSFRCTNFVDSICSVDDLRLKIEY